MAAELAAAKAQVIQNAATKLKQYVDFAASLTEDESIGQLQLLDHIHHRLIELKIPKQIWCEIDADSQARLKLHFEKMRADREHEEASAHLTDDLSCMRKQYCKYLDQRIHADAERVKRAIDIAIAAAIVDYKKD